MTITMTVAQADAEYKRLDGLTPAQKRAEFSSWHDYNEACCKCIEITMSEEEKQMLNSIKI